MRFEQAWAWPEQFGSWTGWCGGGRANWPFLLVDWSSEFVPDSVHPADCSYRFEHVQFHRTFQGSRMMTLLSVWIVLLFSPRASWGEGATECPCVSNSSEGYEALRLEVQSLNLGADYGIDGCKAYDATRLP